MGLFSLTAPVLVATPAVAAATVLVVETTADSPVRADCGDDDPLVSLRQALCLAAAHGTAVVEVPAGTYLLTAGPLVVAPGAGGLELELQGAGAAGTVVDAQGTSRVLDVDPDLLGDVDLTVSGVTLRNGVAPAGTGGGGAVVAGTDDPGAPHTLTLRDCVVTGNRNAPAGAGSPVDAGGAVSMTGGTLRVERCTFSGNTAENAGGGAIAYTGVGTGGSVVVDGSTFSGNAVTAATAAATVGGGAIDVAWGSPTTTITGSTFSGNGVTTGTRPATGSAVRVTAGSATLSGVSVGGSTATGGTGSTGAVHLTSGTVADSRLAGNVTTEGGVPRRVGVWGATSAVRTWWGCSGGPGASGCDTAGAGTTTAPHAVVSLTAPTSASTGDTVTAALEVGTSDGGTPSTTLLGAMAGTPLTWSGPTFTSAASSLPASGSAVATFVASEPVTVGATLDDATVTADVDVSGPPVVTTQPADVTVLDGAAASFTVAVAGSPAPTVTWERRAGPAATWETVTGATGTTLTFTPTRDRTGSQVRAVVTNAVATVRSQAATLQVTWGPESVVGPEDAAGLAGEDVTFTASAAGSPAPTVQWQTSGDGTTWADVTGATAWSWTRTLTAGDAGLHVRALVTGAAGTVPSATARVTVESLPSFEVLPTSTDALPGDDVTFSATVAGTPTPTLTWQALAPGSDTWVDVATGGSVTFPAVTAAQDGTRVRAIATSPRGTVEHTVTLGVLHGPTFTQQPQDATVTAGDVATFTAAAAGNPAPTARWETSRDGTTWTAVSGATAWTYARTTADADHGLLVRVVATGHGGEVASSPALLTVRTPPAVTAQPADVTVDLGTTATFGVAVDGRPTPTVQWQRRVGGDWVDVPGATGTTLSVAGAEENHGAVHRAVVVNALGTATSDPATLTVLTPPVTTDPQDAATAPGVPVTFDVTVTGRPAPAVTWQTSRDGVTWDTAGTGTTLTLVPTLDDDGLRVRAVATADLVAGPVSVTSAEAELVVAVAPELLDAPDPVSTFTAGVRGTLRWTVLAAGGTATWQVSRDGGATWSPVPAGWTPDEEQLLSFVRAAGPAVRTVHSLSFSPVAGDDGAIVRLSVVNPGGTVTGSTTLDVRAAPAPAPGPTDPAAPPVGGPAAGGGDGAVTPARPGGASLASTGTGSLPLLAVAALLATVGVAVVAAVTRRRLG